MVVRNLKFFRSENGMCFSRGDCKSIKCRDFTPKQPNCGGSIVCVGQVGFIRTKFDPKFAHTKIDQKFSSTKFHPKFTNPKFTRHETITAWNHLAKELRNVFTILQTLRPYSGPRRYEFFHTPTKRNATYFRPKCYEIFHACLHTHTHTHYSLVSLRGKCT